MPYFEIRIVVANPAAGEETKPGCVKVRIERRRIPDSELTPAQLAAERFSQALHRGRGRADTTASTKTGVDAILPTFEALNDHTEASVRIDSETGVVKGWIEENVTVAELKQWLKEKGIEGKVVVVTESGETIRTERGYEIGDKAFKPNDAWTLATYAAINTRIQADRKAAADLAHQYPEDDPDNPNPAGARMRRSSSTDSFRST